MGVALAQCFSPMSVGVHLPVLCVSLAPLLVPSVGCQSAHPPALCPWQVPGLDNTCVLPLVLVLVLVLVLLSAHCTFATGFKAAVADTPAVLLNEANVKILSEADIVLLHIHPFFERIEVWIGLKRLDARHCVGRKIPFPRKRGVKGWVGRLGPVGQFWQTGGG